MAAVLENFGITSALDPTRAREIVDASVRKAKGRENGLTRALRMGLASERLLAAMTYEVNIHLESCIESQLSIIESLEGLLRMNNIDLPKPGAVN